MPPNTDGALRPLRGGADLAWQSLAVETGMPTDILVTLRRLTDTQLVAKVKSLVASERATTAELVALLAELDTRDVHLRAGYSSLFTYCRDALGLSEHEAYNRIESARAVRRFPVILPMLRDGSASLTAVRLLAPHLTADNHLSVLASARGKRKAEVEVIVAQLAPRPDVPASVRKVRSFRTTGEGSPPSPLFAGTGGGLSAGTGDGVGAGIGAGIGAGTGERVGGVAGEPAGEEASGEGQARVLAAVRSAPPPTAPVPLSEDRYKVQFTIGGETLEKLRLAKDMLRHAIPSGDEAAILDRALTVLLADLARKKFAATKKPGRSRGTARGSRHIPAEVRRTVWLRDLGRCAFMGTGGRRCAARAFLEFHHVRPWTVGGEATVGNVQLRCRRHNGYEAKEFFVHRQAGAGAPVVREAARAYGARRQRAARRQEPGGPATRSGTSRRQGAQATPTINRTTPLRTIQGTASTERMRSGSPGPGSP
jgi:hypothetical protein